MYDLKVVVEEVKGFCDMPMKPGDYFEVKGGRIIVPEGKYICLWALQSMMPFLPLKERRSDEENDWVPYTKRICCPDPNGMVIYRIDTVDPGTGKVVEDEDDGGVNAKSRMFVDEDKCSGCRACETVCSFTHSGNFCGENSRIKVEKDECQGIDLPCVCRQCGNAPCLEACPVGALSRDLITRAVLVDQNKCIGCRTCVKACTFNGIRFSHETGKAFICDLCGGDPACIKRCPTGAIKFVTQET